MKQLYTLIVLLFVFGLSAKAQRIVDLQLTQTSPKDGDTILPGGALAIDYTLKDIGTTALNSTDSIAFSVLLNGNVLQFVVGGSLSPYLPLPGAHLATGDSIKETFTMNLDTSLVVGSYNVCIQAIPFNHSADSVKDTILANNGNCITIHIVKAPNGVPLINTLSSAVQVYPVPASGTVNFKIESGKDDEARIKIFDIAGRYTGISHIAPLSIGANNISIDISSLQNGAYIYQLSVGTEKVNGKLLIH